MKVLLVVLWLVGGQPTIVTDGWSPMQFDTQEECEQRLDFLTNHIEQHAEDYLPLHSAMCGTQEEIQNMIDIEILSEPA